MVDVSSIEEVGLGEPTAGEDGAICELLPYGGGGGTLLVIGLLSVDDVGAAGMLGEDGWPIVMTKRLTLVEDVGAVGTLDEDGWSIVMADRLTLLEDVGAVGVLDEDPKPTVMVIGPPPVEDVGAAGVLEVLTVSPTGLEVMGGLSELTDEDVEELDGEDALELLGITARASRTFQCS